MSESVLTKHQVKTFGPRAIDGFGKGAAIWASCRFDDECDNRHNTFSITADVRVPKHRDSAACGCLHEEIAKVFPELEYLIKWHLCSADGPMHYPANVLYLAGDRDCWGKLAGEPYRFETHIQFGDNPIKHKFGGKFTKFLLEATAHPDREKFDFKVLPISHDLKERGLVTYKFSPKYTFGGFDAEWHECPFDNEQEALDFLTALQRCNPQFVEVTTDWGKGKERELDAARRSAIWPDATDEELTAPDLKERLEARLPALLIEFKAAMESLGFTW